MSRFAGLSNFVFIIEVCVKVMTKLKILKPSPLNYKMATMKRFETVKILFFGICKEKFLRAFSGSNYDFKVH